MSPLSTSERDAEVCASILRNLLDAARDCEQLAAGYSADGDSESAADTHVAALRYRQLAARAMGCWADADHLASLVANAAADPESEACAAQETQEIPRVH
ncbi:MAG TPA: hypothetical protein VGD91_19380 [Trebonia sp.]